MIKVEELFIEPTATVLETLRKLDETGQRILFIAPEGQLKAVITDGDIRKFFLRGGTPDQTVDNAANYHPLSLPVSERGKARKMLQKHCIDALPILNKRGVITDIVFARGEDVDNRKRADIPVVMMAGGLGTRLYPYTKILPKPLIPIGDIPIMERIIDKFRDVGVTDFYATVNYRKNMIKSYFTDTAKDYEIKYVEENQPLGTAGSLRLIEEDFEQPFIVTNCDILIHADYEDVYRYHRESGNELTIVSALKNIVVPYGVIHSSENGAVQSMEEKPKLSYFVNTGMYILNPELKKEIPEDTFYHMTDLTDKLLKENRKVGMYPISEDSFLDMGEFEEMHRMEKKLDLKSE